MKGKNKKIKVKKSWLFDRLVKCQTATARDEICKGALENGDSRLKGITKNFDILAREAYYHESCRKKLTQNDSRNPKGTDIISKEREEVHGKAFEYLSDYVNKSVIKDLNVERMTMLREKYLLYIQEHFPSFYNDKYKTYKLKNKLISRFGDKLNFWQPNYMSELVYSSSIVGGQAVESAFVSAASEQRRVEDRAYFEKKNFRKLF